MKRWVLSASILLSVISCGREQPTSSDTQPHAPAPGGRVSEEAGHRAAPVGSSGHSMPFGGAYTGAVYATKRGTSPDFSRFTIEEIEAAIAVCPTNADLWFLLGKTCLSWRYKDVAHAATAFEKAAEIAPDALLAKACLAETHADRDNTPDAQRLYREAWTLARGEDDRAAWLASVGMEAHQALRNGKGTDWALDLLREALPAAPEARTPIAEILARQNRNDEALDAIVHGFAATTNAGTQRALLGQLIAVKDKVSDKKAGQDTYDRLIASSTLSEYDRLALELRQVKYEDRPARLPDLCNRMAACATNAQQRFEALQPLARLYQGAPGRKGELLAMIDTIVGSNTPDATIAEQAAGWLRSVGATNEMHGLLLHVADSTTNENDIATARLALASSGKDIIEDEIDALAARCPSNAAVLNRVALLYEQKEWYDKAIEFRTQALALETNDTQRARQISHLVGLSVKYGDTDGAQQLVDDNQGALSNATDAMFTLVQLCKAQGGTNDAYEMLLLRGASARHEADRLRTLDDLLKTRWPEQRMRVRAAEKSREISEGIGLEFRFKNRAGAFNKVAKAYVQLQDLDAALDACKETFLAGGNPESFTFVCRKINDPKRIEAMIRSIIAQTSSQSVSHATAADACLQAQLPELALELYLLSWSRGNDDYARMQNGVKALKLACELGNTAVRDQLLDQIEKGVLNGFLPSWMSWELSGTLQQIGATGRHERILLSLIDKGSREQQLSAMQTLAWSYMNQGNSNGVRALLARLDGRQLSSYEAYLVASMYQTLGEKDRVRQLVAGIETQLTNSALVYSQGYMLLYMLQNMGEGQRAKSLARQWMGDSNIAVNAKMSVLSYLTYNQGNADAIELAEKLAAEMPAGYERNNVESRLLELYAAGGDREKMKRLADAMTSRPEIRQWEIERIVTMFEGANMVSEAVCYQQQAIDKAGESVTVPMLVKLTELYLKAGDTAAALERAKEALDMDPNNTRALQFIGRIHTRMGNADEAAQMYYKALLAAPNGQARAASAKQLADLIRSYGAHFDTAAAAAALLKDGHTIDSLMSAAGLVAAGNDVAVAQGFLDEAVAQATVDSQKAGIYQQWLQMMRQAGDEDKTIEACRNLVAVSTSYEKYNTASQLQSMLISAGRYDEAIEEAKKIIAGATAGEEMGWAKQSMYQSMARAHLEAGNPDEAWACALESARANNSYITADFLHIARETGRINEAIPALEQACAGMQEHSRVQAASLLAQAYRDTGRQEELTKLLDTLDQSASSMQDYYTKQVADILSSAGRQDRAIELYKQIATEGRQYESHDALTALFGVWKDAGRLDDALAWAAEQKQSAPLLSLMADAYKEQKQPAKALELYQKALSQSPSSPYEGYNPGGIDTADIKKNIAALAAETGNRDLVDTMAKDILKDASGDPINTRMQAARLYQAGKEFDKAAECFTKALGLASAPNQQRSIQEQYAACCSEAEKHDKSAQVYEKLLNDEKLQWQQKIRYQNALADEYEKDDRPNKAADTRDELARSCEQFIKDHPVGDRAMSARFTLADAYAGAGRKDEARRVLQGISDKYPDSSHAKQAKEKMKKL